MKIDTPTRAGARGKCLWLERPERTNMKTIEELRADLEKAERDLYHANLRRQWLEKRLLEAPDEQNFDSVMTELSAQEETIKKLGTAVASARSAWATADTAARYGSAQG